MNKIDEKAIWTLAGNNVVAGQAGGAEAIIRRDQTGVSYGLDFELKHSPADQQNAVLSLHNTVPDGHLMLDEPPVTVISRRDTKIARRAMVDLLNQQIADILGLGPQVK
jgi:uncharacterized protein